MACCQGLAKSRKQLWGQGGHPEGRWDCHIGACSEAREREGERGCGWGFETSVSKAGNQVHPGYRTRKNCRRRNRRHNSNWGRHSGGHVFCQIRRRPNWTDAQLRCAVLKFYLFSFGIIMVSTWDLVFPSLVLACVLAPVERFMLPECRLSKENPQSVPDSMWPKVWYPDGGCRCWPKLRGFDHQIPGAAAQRKWHHDCCVYQALRRDDCFCLFLPQGRDSLHFDTLCMFGLLNINLLVVK